jgi:hypothetical protein
MEMIADCTVREFVPHLWVTSGKRKDFNPFLNSSNDGDDRRLYCQGIILF